MRRRWARLVIAAGLLVLAVLELQGLHREARGQADALRRIRDEVARERGAIAVRMAQGPSSLSAVTALLPAGLAAEIELFDPLGHLIGSHPSPLALKHWLSPADQQRLGSGAPITLPPPAVSPARILTYLSVSWAGRPTVLRIATPADDLVREQEGRRRAALMHGAALGLLLVIGVLALSPLVHVPDAPGPGAALRAYEEAMGRLRAQGAAESVRFEQDRRRLRSALDDKDAMARAGELTAGIVHEVRNGLGAIAGYAQLLERLGDEAAEPARRIRDECSTLETVVRRFIDFVKHEDLRLEAFDVTRMLSRVVAREGRGPGGTTTLAVDPSLRLVGDEEMLERAFENLVRNARAAAGDGGHVWIEAVAVSDELVVAIADDGPGMSAEQRAVIRPFATSKGGLGLGLPIALKIICLHRGDLVLSEGKPRGLIATVRLPAGPRASAGQR
jgi:signal transduction histidine kinase